MAKFEIILKGNDKFLVKLEAERWFIESNVWLMFIADYEKWSQVGDRTKQGEFIAGQFPVAEVAGVVKLKDTR